VYRRSLLTLTPGMRALPHRLLFQYLWLITGFYGTGRRFYPIRLDLCDRRFYPLVRHGLMSRKPDFGPQGAKIDFTLPSTTRIMGLSKDARYGWFAGDATESLPDCSFPSSRDSLALRFNRSCQCRGPDGTIR
jgi:hypothetical protein